MLQAAFQYTSFEEEQGLVHSVFAAIKKHPSLRFARIIYFPECAPADAGKRMAAYANIWSSQQEPNYPKILVVHEGGMDTNKRPLPGCRKTHDSTEVGVNHFRFQLHNRLVRRLDTMIYLTNMELPTQLVDTKTTTRHVLNKQTKDQMMRFMKRNLKSSNEYAEDRYVYSGKSGALQDDMVIPYIMQAYWMDYMFKSSHELWRDFSAKRQRIVTGPPQRLREYEEEVARLREEGRDIYEKPKSHVAAQAPRLPFNATAKATADTRGEWPRLRDDEDDGGNTAAAAPKRRRLDRDPAEDRTPLDEPGRVLRTETAITFDLRHLEEDTESGSILEQ